MEELKRLLAKQRQMRSFVKQAILFYSWLFISIVQLCLQITLGYCGGHPHSSSLVYTGHFFKLHFLLSSLFVWHSCRDKKPRAGVLYLPLFVEMKIFIELFKFTPLSL
ncbi:hypothetical protein ABB37_05214 [Leptomonas pyrrhocoris]|uniref:Uncharacterized protein n=1 Tax=Leptomonas pyrrhocoris TaxID=157538 RepID=A0A0M9G1G9_LEPPY|nr:hypothetical protein ABB37_05214 [Leptomonas pyrrhocoris]KPA80246.1 hypothetical protein ABB37_05214 [Leptomonas pyrrhocoris]|eukprot:XP_015658685.1 hypothetical protein ABB37_05214 [Leptomonas pyrrhocoris]